MQPLAKGRRRNRSISDLVTDRFTAHVLPADEIAAPKEMGGRNRKEVG